MYAVDTTPYLDLRQDLIRYAGNTLSHSEYRVLQFVMERTLRFGKVSEKIPFRHFIEGFLNKDPGCCLAPIPVAKRSIVRAIGGLEQKGLIACSLSGENSTNMITILVDRVAEFLKMCALRVSKAYQNLTNNPVVQHDIMGPEPYSTKGPEPKSTSGSAKKHQPTKGVEIEGVEDKQVDLIPLSVRNTSSLSSSEVVDHIKTMYGERRKTRRISTEEFNPKSFRRIYNDAIAQYAEDHKSSPITPVSYYEAKVFCNSVSGVALFKSGDWKNYIEDCIVNWDEYRNHLQKTWKTHSPPETPVFKFFLTTQGRHYAPYYAARKSGDVERVKRITDNRVGSMVYKLEESNNEIEQLRKQLESKDYAIQELRKESKFNLTLRNKQNTPKTPLMRITPEEFHRALHEELPTWEEIEQGGRSV